VPFCVIPAQAGIPFVSDFPVACRALFHPFPPSHLRTIFGPIPFHTLHSLFIHPPANTLKTQETGQTTIVSMSRVSLIFLATITVHLRLTRRGAAVLVKPIFHLIYSESRIHPIQVDAVMISAPPVFISPNATMSSFALTLIGRIRSLRTATWKPQRNASRTVALTQ